MTSRIKPAAALTARSPARRRRLRFISKFNPSFRKSIMSGAYPVGSALSTEADLCAQFDASRYTIREALRGLTDEGLVSRRQRVGTVVLSHEPQTRYVQSFRAIEDLFQVAIKTHYVLRSTKTVTLNQSIWRRGSAAASARSGCA